MRRICQACSAQIWSLFKNGFCSTPNVPRRGYISSTRRRYCGNPLARQLTTGSILRLDTKTSEARKNVSANSSAAIEAIVLQARQTFGNTLPKNFLSAEEYRIYERFYGPPDHETRPEDVSLLQMPVEDGAEEEEEGNVAWEKDDESHVEEMEYAHSVPVRNNYHDIREASVADQEVEIKAGDCENTERAERTNIEEEAFLVNGTADDFKTRMMLYRDIVAASQATVPVETQLGGTNEIEEAKEFEDDLPDNIQEALDRNQDDDQTLHSVEDSATAYVNGDSIRTHSLTAVGRSDMSHTTLQIPRNTVVDPITALLSDASTKQLSEVARKTFGGPFLPNSTATPNTKGHLHQQPIALEASQRMGEMEANSYLAAVTPGTYAVVMSCLVEIRKRLGPEWIKGLLSKDGGPRILDSGGAGAGVLAWRDLLKTEWELLHPGGVPDNKPVPIGKSTVVVGSTTLRTRMSKLLENTSFIPRLPDYNPSHDPPSAEQPAAERTTTVPRKKYDIIVAPHSLWTLGEDYKRKIQIHNFWSMLDPNGGVLLVVEKGVPRGFELIGGAREVLLKHHIASPGSETTENRVEEPYRARFREKETGMIIAPCTNHFKCPMYLKPGKMTGRKNYCHFSQRYIRPQFLQQILEVKDRNHEDIRYSYVAVQRGIDQRRDLGIPQGKAASDAAYVGYEDAECSPGESLNDRSHLVEPQFPNFHPLSLPRAILPPLKPPRHVILDLCTPMGQIERWIVPKSFSKQAYRDARKSRWGDLWALGAKTRIPRNLVLGNPQPKRKGRKVYKISEDDVQGSSGLSAKFKKRMKKEVNAEDEMFEDDL